MTQLGVNVDHVATLRNARGGESPDPVQAALAAERGGADGIVCHLREDRRHIRDEDLRRLMAAVTTGFQLEMACHPEIVEIALALRPREVMVVPERRAELTTEGGLDCVAQGREIGPALRRLVDAGLHLSLFVDPEPEQLRAARDLGASVVELHTGPYAHAVEPGRELARLAGAAQLGQTLGLEVHAGHGLNYANIGGLLRAVPVARVNIGHSIVSRAVFTGFEAAVREMKALVSR